jgi:hypothetical protein
LKVSFDSPNGVTRRIRPIKLDWNEPSVVNDKPARHVGAADFQFPRRKALSSLPDLDRDAARDAFAPVENPDGEWVLAAAHAAVNRGVGEEVVHMEYYTKEHYAVHGLYQRFRRN